MELKEKIFSKAEELFLKYGVRSVTMDDLASELGASKKTLYQFAKNKEELIYKTLENHFSSEKAFCCGITDANQNAIDELLSIGRHLIEQLQGMNPMLLFELKKYYPKAYRLMEDYRMGFIFQTVANNMKKGIKDGLYRKDVKPDIIAKIYVARTDILFDTTIFPPKEYNWVDVYREVLIYHIRGIASEKGIDYLTENIKTIR